MLSERGSFLWQLAGDVVECGTFQMSVTSTLSTLSGCSEGTSGGRPDSSSSTQPGPRVPPPDYDAADSGTGDSDNEDITPTISRIDLSKHTNHHCKTADHPGQLFQLGLKYRKYFAL